MITVSTIGYSGRLGNQMFQYAAGFALARAVGTDFVVPGENCRQELVDSGGNISRCYLYDVFPCLTAERVPRGSLRIAHRYLQAHFGFDPGFHALDDNTDLSGYFQSEKWFGRVISDVREEFRLEPVVSDAKGFIHVRRGDYCTKPDYHPHSDMAYYSRALAHFDAVDFLVFSDDPGWCRSRFRGSRFRVVEGLNELDSLRMMAGCECAIIANSSFSWWGAWLGGARTIAPRTWFGPRFGEDPWDDIYQEEWLVL